MENEDNNRRAEGTCDDVALLGAAVEALYHRQFHYKAGGIGSMQWAKHFFDEQAVLCVTHQFKAGLGFLVEAEVSLSFQKYKVETSLSLTPYNDAKLVQVEQAFQSTRAWKVLLEHHAAMDPDAAVVFEAHEFTDAIIEVFETKGSSVFGPLRHRCGCGGKVPFSWGWCAHLCTTTFAFKQAMQSNVPEVFKCLGLDLEALFREDVKGSPKRPGVNTSRIAKRRRRMHILTPPDCIVLE